jgi:hypothetical protein
MIRQAVASTESTEWRCRRATCRSLLGKVQAGTLRPHVAVQSVDCHGVAAVPCPRCGRVKVWFPTREATSSSEEQASAAGAGA